MLQWCRLCSIACICLATTSWWISAQDRTFADTLRHAEGLTKEKKWKDAAPLWKQIVAQNPVRGDFWLKLGEACYEGKDYRPAIAAYERALELKAFYPHVLAYDIACCHALLGEKEPAMRWLDIAVKTGFRELDHARTDEDLKSLRDDPRYRELVAMVDVSKMSRDEGWRYDLKFLDREIRRLHYKPYHEFTREQVDAHIRSLHDDIPKLTDAQIMTGLVRLARMAGDGHTSLRPGGAIPMLPLQLFHFEDGVFVTAAAPDCANLAGAQVLKIGDHAIDFVLKAVEPTISRDNSMQIKATAPVRITIPLLLNGLGLIPKADETALTVRDAKGSERIVTLKAVPTNMNHGQRATEGWATARQESKRPEPLYLKNRKAAYWFEHLPEQKVVYCQYNSVRNDASETFEQFCTRLFKFVEENDLEKLIVDLRWNGGGNTFLNRPLIHGLIRCTKINEPGKLFVVIGRNTFSAAQNCTTDIEMHTKATFVGEPTGSSPNFIGESIKIELPYSKMVGSVSDLYWGRSWPMDYRTWIAPQLYAPPTFAAYKDNRDVALEAVLGADIGSRRAESRTEGVKP